MTKTYQSHGTVKYQGKWIVLDCDREIGRYYRHWILSMYGIKCGGSRGGEHITVVAGKYDDVSLHDQWQMHHGERVTFNYSAPPISKDGYFWLPVECQRLGEIRSELGLSGQPKYPFHLTVGNVIHK